MTRQRAVVLDVVRSDMCHHTAEEIFSLAKEMLPGITRATVYNNLRALEEEGTIRRVSGEGGADRYDNVIAAHGHAICKVCGRMWDFKLDGLEGALTDAVGLEIDSYELKARVVCDGCSGRSAMAESLSKSL